MASTAEIKSRIRSVEDTRKITNAMYLIASTKLRRARNDLDKTRPYFDALQAEIKRIFRTVRDVDSRVLLPPRPGTGGGGAYGCLVITADKGLAGAYNQNVIKEAQKLMEEHGDMQLFVVGEYGRHFFTQHHIPIEHTFLYTAQNPTMERAREISSLLLDKYDPGRTEEDLHRLHRPEEHAWRPWPGPPGCCPSTGPSSSPPTQEKRGAQPL